MHRSRAQTPGRVSAKRKPAPATESTVQETQELPEDFDAWAESLKKKGSGCSACADPAVVQTIDALLHSMVRKRAFKITIHEIHRMVLKRHPDSGVGPRGLERHLLSCVRELYDRARGRSA